jgi:hypothetical protein
MASRPPPELVAEWYARLPEGTNIEDERERLMAANRMDKHLPLRGSYHSTPGAWGQLGAASWRMPLVDVRGGVPRMRRGQYRRRLTVTRQRRILRMLADGATTREVVATVHTNFTVIAALRRAALQWKDPDDEC